MNKGGYGRVHDRVGERHGRLEVIQRGPNTSRGEARWLCRCTCGRWVVARGFDLASGNTSSCGCYQQEVRRRSGAMSRGRPRATTPAQDGPGRP